MRKVFQTAAVVSVALAVAVGVTLLIIGREPVGGIIERVGASRDVEDISIKLENNPNVYTCASQCYGMQKGDEVILYFAPISGLEVNHAAIKQTASSKGIEQCR